jgi:SulP family sulfate permease
VGGFITASGIIIALSQLRHIAGIDGHGDNLPELLHSLAISLPDFNGPTLAVGAFALLALFWMRRDLARALRALGLTARSAEVLAKGAPVLVIVLTTAVSMMAGLEARGVAVVGEVPQGLPAFSTPVFSVALWSELAVSALLVSLIGFVESVSVGRTLGAKRRQNINANQELLALGAANMASAASGGFPVTGGFSRSVVNFDAGAQTQLAGVMAAAGIALATLFLTPVLYYLPKATLAATIIVAVLGLVDTQLLRRAWRYSRRDFTSIVVTIVATLGLGVEIGVLAGIVVSVALHLHKTTRPHIAIVGEVPGTEHFRNVMRHDVITYPSIVSIRVDESLYFANASYLESAVYAIVAGRSDLRHIILQCTAVNEIDLSALETLEQIDHRLREQGIALHLSEVKGPVMDALRRTDFIEHLSGQVYLSQHQAVESLRPMGGVTAGTETTPESVETAAD